MFIHWYPGHMAKAMRTMRESVPLADCVIYILDSRAPFSSVNPSFDEIIGAKPRLYVLNKSDLVPENALSRWREYFESGGNRCIIRNSTKKGGTKKLVSLLRELNAGVLEKYGKRGINKTLRAMVVGIPNCGKSTFINGIAPEKKAATGNRPGITRDSRWIRIDPYLELLDTPGVLYPDFADKKKAVKLAMIGSVRDEVVDEFELAETILDFLSTEYPENLKKRYGAADFADIAEKMGYLSKGGETDARRTAKAVINDFRKGAFGKIILEKTRQ